MSNYRQLLVLSSKALSTFDPESSGVDVHLEKFFQLPECSVKDDADFTFISEVFAGCVRYQGLIKVVVNGFYAKDGKTSLRSDANLYSVLCYLMMFRLEELGIGHFKRLVNSQHTGKMHKFISFLFTETNLKGWIYDEWCRVYDSSFVDTTIMSSMLRCESEMKEYIQELSDKVANRNQSKREVKPVTETKPFNITKPRPRDVPTPEKIPTLAVYRAVPKSTYSKPTEQERLAQAFESNRKKAEGTLLESNRLQFSCANAEKSEKTKTKMDQIIADREARLQYSPVKPTPVPTSIKGTKPVKLNAAAILREGARVQKHEEEEDRRLASLEAGQHDASDFIKWQEEMKQKAAAEKLADIERKHLEGQLSYEEAIIAKQNHLRETHGRVQLLKEESEAMMKQYFAQREEEQQEMRRLVEATMAGHQSTKESKRKLQVMKQKIVQQVSRERQELMKRALEEAEVEMRRKIELIQQIRAMESVPVIRTKFVDITETSGQGLLSEMSIAELRERLSLMKIAEAEEEEMKRKEIQTTKQAKEQLLSETLVSINKYRADQTRQASARQEQGRVTFQKHHKELKEKKLATLQEKLEMKRRERERLQQTIPSVTPAGHRNTSSNSKIPGEKQSVERSASAGNLQSSSKAITALLRATNKTAVM